MKKLLIGILLSVSISAFSNTEIAKVQERNSNRALVYSQDGNDVVFTLKDHSIELEIKRLTLEASSNHLSIIGDVDVYNFQILKSMSGTTGDIYEWCWSDGALDFHLPATIVAGLGFATMAVCATVPSVPFILGIIALPVDGVLTLGDRVFDEDAIAVRKFNKLLTGKNRKASRKVFNSLIDQIKKL